jgi:hypothetical protein
MVKWIALALLVLAGWACTLFDDDPPKNTCKVDADCFAGQETCEGGVCVPIDAGMP